MSRSVPVIAVSLPATNAADAVAQVALAAQAHADLAEIRFDLWASSTPDQIDRLFPSPLPLIATLRSTAEGGAGPDDRSTRAARLEGLSRYPFRWIDLEWARDRPLLDSLPPPSKLGRIVSTHFPDGVTKEQWARALREPVPDGCVRKVVARSEIAPFLTELLPLLPAAGIESAIALTTGASGPLSRAWAGRLGIPIVFAGLPEAGSIPVPPPVEPSQLPVDRLRPFLLAVDSPPLFGLVGHPVHHSRSPSLHARWMRALGRSGLYLPLDFPTEREFVDSLAFLSARGFRGLNVTHPWKAAAFQSATESSAGAEACGVANSLTFRGDAIEAENTDLVAILRRLEELERLGVWKGTSLVVLGSGGSARATLAAARTLGVRPVIYARRGSAASELAREFGGEAPDSPRPDPGALIVHATSVGRAGSEELDLPLDRLIARDSYLLDWVYAPDLPVIADAARRAGAAYEDGRRLLVYQAAASFALWWGEELPPEIIGETLREEGCAG